MSGRWVFIAGLLVGATTGAGLTAANLRNQPPPPVESVTWLVDGEQVGVCDLHDQVADCRTVTPVTAGPAVPYQEEP